MKNNNSPKLTEEEIENLKILMLILKIECANKNLLQRKLQSHMASLVNYIKLARKIYINCTQTVAKNRGGNHFPIFLIFGQSNPNTKTRQRHYEKRKPQTNIPYKPRHKHP